MKHPIQLIAKVPFLRGATRVFLRALVFVLRTLGAAAPTQPPRPEGPVAVWGVPPSGGPARWLRPGEY